MEENQVSQEYLSGFNQGYYIQQHEPELVDKIISTDVSKDYLEGFNDGSREYEQERIESEFKQLDRDKDLGKDWDREY